MSHPSWLPPKSTNEPVGHITARMETTHTFGTPSISVSTQQTPKKFAPVVAPKPKYNPYKQPGGDGDFLPPPPPPADDLGNITSSQGAFPPPPPLDDVTFKVQMAFAVLKEQNEWWLCSFCYEPFLSPQDMVA